MKKTLLCIMLAFSSMIILTSCANKALPMSREGSISESFSGVVDDVEIVDIQGEGDLSSILGMIVGGVLGSQVGEGAGQALATTAGSMTGAIVGQKADIRKAQRITITFESGKTITTVLAFSKNNPIKYKPGDRVRVFITNGKVTEIRPK